MRLLAALAATLSAVLLLGQPAHAQSVTPNGNVTLGRCNASSPYALCLHEAPGGQWLQIGTYNPSTHTFTIGAGQIAGLSGDCTIAVTGVITCTKTNGTAFGALATLGIGAGLSSGSGNLNCNSFSSTAFGCVPASGGGTSNYLRADGTWNVPPMPLLQQPQTGSVAVSTQSWYQRRLNIADFGALCNSNGTTGNGHDDTAAIQAAINAAISTGIIYIDAPFGICRTTSTLTSTGNITFTGQGANSDFSASNSVGKGTWLYIDHGGKGWRVDLPNPAANTRTEFHNFGTLRNQPVPGGGAYTPTGNDYDIFIQPTTISAGGGFDVMVDNVLFLNSTLGIYLEQAPHATLTDLRMQCFQKCITVDSTFDVMRFHNIHIWPFWSQNTNVLTYQQNNLHGFEIKRLDNPDFSNVFVYAANAGIYIAHSAAGNASKVSASNLGIDFSEAGIVWDPATTGVDLYLANSYFFGRGATGSGSGIIMQGTNSKLFASNIAIDQEAANGIIMVGTTNFFYGSHVFIESWDGLHTGNSAVNVGTSNVAVMGDGILAFPNGAVGAAYQGAGEIRGAWLNWSPVASVSSGSITTSSFSASLYKIDPDGQGVSFTTTFNITTNGTGAGTLSINLPNGTANGSWEGRGREAGVTGAPLQVDISTGGTTFQVLTTANAYPGQNGAVLRLTGNYVRQ
jgi:hypothetical protein